MPKLPQGFIDNMHKLLGDEANNFFDAMDRSSVKAMTVDFNKIKKEVFLKHFTSISDNVPGVANGYVYSGKIGNDIFHHAGVIYSQDASAMYPVEALGIKSGDCVLDVCSAPGGKSIQILEKLNNTGLLIANEYVYSRAKILYENLVRFGYENYSVTNNLPRDFDTKIEVFDKILVDAPCSGEGMFRKNNIETYSWNEKNVNTCAIRQLEILESVKSCLKKGGRLVYSTCTYNEQENEKVVIEFLKRNPNFKLIDLPKIVKDNTSRGIIVDQQYDTTKCGRRYPHLHNGEGQFMALFEKVGVKEDIEYDYYSDSFKSVSKKDIAMINKKLGGVGISPVNELLKKGDNYFIPPRFNFDYSGLNVLTLGVVVGQIDKDVKLNHAFYKAYSNLFTNKVELNDEQAVTYLTGNVCKVDCNFTGICVVNYMGISLGGGKVVDGVLKNYYPKELRIK